MAVAIVFLRENSKSLKELGKLVKTGHIIIFQTLFSGLFMLLKAFKRLQNTF
jgi:hypothetical protein